MCACVCICSPFCQHIDLYIWRPEIDLRYTILQLPAFFLLFVLRQVLSLVMEPVGRTHQLVSFQGCCVSIHTVLDLQTHATVWSFHTIDMVRTQFPLLTTWPLFYRLSHLSNSSLLYFFLCSRPADCFQKSSLCFGLSCLLWLISLFSSTSPEVFLNHTIQKVFTCPPVSLSLLPMPSLLPTTAIPFLTYVLCFHNLICSIISCLCLFFFLSRLLSN